MNIVELKNYILSNEFEAAVKEIYCSDSKEVIDDQRERYKKLIDKTCELYGDGDYHIISSPGRVEIAGNHTDHQKGHVIAASINIDNVCIVKKSDDMLSTIYDIKFSKNEVDVSDLSMHEEEKNNTLAIIRGTAARLKMLSYNIGGFKACQDSRVIVGSGLSSSACFEIMITEIYNCLYNDKKISEVERAEISQWVENNFFGKPCGLMDQMAISVGSFVSIDFYDEKPTVKKRNFSFSENGYKLLIINTNGDHADLTDEYSAIPYEMKLVAKYFGEEYLSRVDEDEFYNNIKSLRETIKNDRAVLRAYHYFKENNRVMELDKALENNDILKVISIMKMSGNSSYKFLQNVYVASSTNNQPIAIALAISENLFGDDGMCRVQGGGFAGTIQSVVKNEKVDMYINEIDKIFGKGSASIVEIRKSGTRVIV